MLAVAPPLVRRRDAPWRAALLGVVHARTGLPTRSLAGVTAACASSCTSVHRQSRGWVCVGSDICGTEERRARGRALGRASCSDSSRLFERSERSERSEFRDGPRDRAPQQPCSKSTSSTGCGVPERV
jgi:hypothetical protein